MKIIFAGTPKIVIETLNVIHASSHEICLILTNEDKPFGRGKKLQNLQLKYSLKKIILTLDSQQI